MINKILVLFFVVNFYFSNWNEECKTIKCSVCCGINTSGKPVCLSEPLKCRLEPNSDFSILVTTLIIIGSFVIGIPLFLFIINLLVIERFCFKMSICEFIVNYIFLCRCFKKKKKKKNIDNQDKIDIDKKKIIKN